MFNLDLATLISRLFILTIAFTVHEFAHAWMADYFGDNTPRANGRLTLNPMAHLDPLGSLMLIFAGFGWARPVPVNAYALNRHSPAAYMWVALAGPLSNLLLAIIAAIPFRLGFFSYMQTISSMSNMGAQLLPTLPQFLLEFVYINLLLLLFNFIPLAPLDGDKIASYIFPPTWAEVLDRIRPYGPLILMVLFIGGPYLGINVFGWVIDRPLMYLFSILVG